MSRGVDTTTGAGTPRPTQRTGALVTAVACLCVVALLAVPLTLSVRHPLFQGMDTDWWRLMVDSRSSWQTDVAKGLAHTWSGPIYIGICVAVECAALLLRGWWAAVYLAATIVTGRLIDSLLKVAIGRPRPPGELMHPAGMAFPSGHTVATATVVAVVVLLVLPPAGRRRPRVSAPLLCGATALTALTMWSRTYLGVHWLSDTMAGAGLGIGTACATYCVFAIRLERERDRRAPVSGAGA